MPHPILFLENVPLNADADAVSALFRQFMGFKETRMVPSRPGLAVSAGLFRKNVLVFSACFPIPP